MRINWPISKPVMAKSGQSKPGQGMVTVYGKIPKELAERLDQLAEERRWSRAQMVTYCIEQFVERESKGPKR
jgi:hypothetical protein